VSVIIAVMWLLEYWPLLVWQTVHTSAEKVEENGCSPQLWALDTGHFFFLQTKGAVFFVRIDPIDFLLDVVKGN